MAGTESDSASENPQDEQDMKTMFKSMMKEFKDLKQTVTSLMDNLLEGELDIESDGETSAEVQHRVVKSRARICSRKLSRSWTSPRKQVQMLMRSLFNLWKASSKTNYKKIKLN